jgi:hypothetical protein
LRTSTSNIDLCGTIITMLSLLMTMLERAIDENTEMATDEKKVLPKKIGTNNSLSRVLDNDEM